MQSSKYDYYLGYGENYTFLQLPRKNSDDDLMRRVLLAPTGVFFETWDNGTLTSSIKISDNNDLWTSVNNLNNFKTNQDSYNLQTSQSITDINDIIKFKFIRLNLKDLQIQLTANVEKIIRFNNIMDNVNTDEWVSSTSNNGIIVSKNGFYLLVTQGEVERNTIDDSIFYYIVYRNGVNLFNFSSSGVSASNVNIRNVFPVYLYSGDFISANCIINGGDGTLIFSELGLIPLSF